jgi:hypothetical protein
VAVAVLVGGWAAASASQAQPAVVDQGMAAAAPAADAGKEQEFVNAINQLRASKGLRQLQVSGELTGVARGWTDRMVANGQISHNPNLGSSVSGGWTKLGENVGVGYDVRGLMDAFIKSPDHYRNLVDPDWTHVGVGVSYGGGRMYTTHNFMARPAAAPPPPPPPPPTQTTSAPPPPPPPPTTTTAPPPPTTTTTLPPPEPEPTEERVNALLEPLRSLEQR